MNRRPHQHICLPVAPRLRLSMLLACFAQALKLAIWAATLWLVHTLGAADFFQAAVCAAALLILSVAYYTLKIRAHDESHYAAYRLEEILRVRLAAKIARLPLGESQRQGAGGLGKVLIDDVRELHAYVADAPPLKAEAYATPVLIFALLFWLDWRWAAAVLLFCAAVFGVLKLLFGHSLQFRRRYGAALAELNRTIIEYVQGMAAVRIFNAGEGSFGRYRKALDDFNALMHGWLRRTGTGTRLARTLFTPMPVMMFVLAALLLFPKSTDAETLFAFLLLSAGVVETMHPYMSMHHLLEKSRAAIERINELEAAPELPEPAVPQQPQGSTICYQNVGFAYHSDGKNVLKNINFTITEGSFTAIIGSSGSGKTTLVSLLARFWDVDSGSISIGGTDIRRIASADLMAQMSFVFQDNFLFSCSVADNIRYGLDGISDEAVIAAAKQAEIHDFIMTLPENYQTQAGERGALLSGGQKQRLTIARAFLQNRPILILDEPTAFADARNEALLQRAFRRLAQGRTVIMIAHRLPNIVDADQIICMENGSIAAIGTHSELSAQSPFYQRLWQDYRHAQSWQLAAEAA